MCSPQNSGWPYPVRNASKYYFFTFMFLSLKPPTASFKKQLHLDSGNYFWRGASLAFDSFDFYRSSPWWCARSPCPFGALKGHDSIHFWSPLLSGPGQATSTGSAGVKEHQLKDWPEFLRASTHWTLNRDESPLPSVVSQDCVRAGKWAGSCRRWVVSWNERQGGDHHSCPGTLGQRLLGGGPRISAGSFQWHGSKAWWEACLPTPSAGDFSLLLPMDLFPKLTQTSPESPRASLNSEPVCSGQRRCQQQRSAKNFCGFGTFFYVHQIKKS